MMPHDANCTVGTPCVYIFAGSESDWVLDLVATGFSKPGHLFGKTLRTNEDVGLAADGFKAHCTKVRPWCRTMVAKVEAQLAVTDSYATGLLTRLP